VDFGREILFGIQIVVFEISPPRLQYSVVFFAVNHPLVHGTSQLFTSAPFVPYRALMFIFRSILGIWNPSSF